MTEEEFSNTRFGCVSHYNTKNEHVMTYESVGLDNPILLRMHTPALKDGTWGDAYTVYVFNGIEYKNLTDLLVAVSAFEN